MLIIVAYDVSTETKEGRRRLRRVAKVCESIGQRVQNSVFECRVNQMQYEELERNLLAEINEKEDCLRLYRLTEPVELHIKERGHFRAVDFEGPLVIRPRANPKQCPKPGGFALRVTHCAECIFYCATRIVWASEKQFFRGSRKVRF